MQGWTFFSENIIWKVCSLLLVLDCECSYNQVTPSFWVCLYTNSRLCCMHFSLHWMIDAKYVCYASVDSAHWEAAWPLNMPFNTRRYLQPSQFQQNNNNNKTKFCVWIFVNLVSISGFKLTSIFWHFTSVDQHVPLFTRYRISSQSDVLVMMLFDRFSRKKTTSKILHSVSENACGMCAWCGCVHVLDREGTWVFASTALAVRCMVVYLTS